MTDTWGVHLIDKHGFILWQGEAEKDDLLDPKLMPSIFHAHFITKPNKSMMLGEIYKARVIKNHVVYAVVNFTVPAATSTAYVGGMNGKFGFCVSEGDLVVSEPTVTVLVCTCGVQKFTGGMCSDWCDLVRKQ